MCSEFKIHMELLINEERRRYKSTLKNIKITLHGSWREEETDDINNPVFLLVKDWKLTMIPSLTAPAGISWSWVPGRQRRGIPLFPHS